MKKSYLGLTHPLFLNQAILESGNKRFKQLNQFDAKLDQALQIIRIFFFFYENELHEN